MAKRMVPNRPEWNTVGGSAAFKAAGHIVLPGWRRRMDFAGGCQKVSSLCERPGPLFTALYRAKPPLCSPLPPSAPPALSHSAAPDLRPTVSPKVRE
ncbi:hypothetical protein CesoFtcFv8_020562 [Champsocephalus esox]|uniref:Uncharacterized protein n=1 Tax=Champsocephalus esox TaxID=159716 RepID=A0AAN8BCD8_9TELE|nr:hypothetical protein CesoFtcFv8_020562 [Champsocephalus esox]